MGEEFEAIVPTITLTVLLQLGSKTLISVLSQFSTIFHFLLDFNMINHQLFQTLFSFFFRELVVPNTLSPNMGSPTLKS